MLSRTFVRMDSNDVYVPHKLTTASNGETWCSCVYACDKFLTYPVDVWGRRIIPENSMCPHMRETGLACSGAYIWCDGRFLTNIPQRKTLQVLLNSKQR